MIKTKASQKGFGLLEVLIAFVILGFMSIAVERIQKTNRWQLAYNDNRSLALQKAQRIFDSLQVAGLGSIDTGMVDFDCLEIDTLTKPYHCYVHAQNLGELEDGYVFSKKVNVKVEWDMIGVKHHVEMNGVVE